MNMKSRYQMLVGGKKIDPVRWIFSVAVVIGCAGAVDALADDADHERARNLMRSGEILSLERILQKHPRARDGRILEVELEEKRGQLVYEIDVMDHQGRVLEFKFDARNGQLLREKVED